MSDIYISVATSTWNRESNGLYDYESSNIFKNKFKIESSCYLIQNNNKLETHPKNSDYTPTTETKFLLCFSREENQFVLECNSEELFPQGVKVERSWLVLKDIKGSQGYTLSEGDIVRLGKAKVKVKEIKGPKKNRVSKNKLNSKFIYQGGLSGKPKKTETVEPLVVQMADQNDLEINCRVCLMEESTKINPLVKPCNCTGSMALIHIGCLQKWFVTKVATREINSLTSYSWSTLKCELCKFQYPEKVSVDNSVFELLVLKKPENNYITVEVETEKKQETRNVKIISFNDKKVIQLGRGNDSDIKLTDISVSRNHAKIHINEAGLLLSDIKSKFGTLVKIKRKILLTVGTRFSVQCGRNFITLSVKKPFRLFSCFGCSGGLEVNEDRYLREGTEETVNNQV